MNNNGFTLIELVVVIFVLGILAVTVYPRISTDTEYSPFTEKDQVLSLLRSAQQRAMQNTQDSDCQAVYFSGNSIGLAANNNDGTCQSAFINTNTSNSFLFLELDNTLTVADSGGITIPIGLIEFNNLGNPSAVATLTIGGQTRVCVLSQGYIHDCTP